MSDYTERVFSTGHLGKNTVLFYDFHGLAYPHIILMSRAILQPKLLPLGLRVRHVFPILFPQAVSAGAEACRQSGFLISEKHPGLFIGAGEPPDGGQSAGAVQPSVDFQFSVAAQRSRRLGEILLSIRTQ